MKKNNKNKFQQKTKTTEKSAVEEIEEEEIISNEEIENDELDEETEQVPIDEIETDEIDEEEDVPPFLKTDAIDKDLVKVSTNGKVESDEKTNNIALTEEKSLKQKVKALQKAIENKKYSLEREQIKCRDWRVQGKDKDEKATAEYQKRKTELEEMLKKSEERYNKRIAKTKKWWWDYTDNYEITKVKKIQDEVNLLEAELSKLEIKEHETAEVSA